MPPSVVAQDRRSPPPDISGWCACASLPTFVSEQTARRSGTLRLRSLLHERLRQQGDGGHQEQDPAAGRHRLRNAKDVKVLPVPHAMMKLAPVPPWTVLQSPRPGPFLVLARLLPPVRTMTSQGLRLNESQSISSS